MLGTWSGVSARRRAGDRHVAARFRQHGLSPARRFRRGSAEDRGPEARRPAARLADRRHQRALESLFAKQEERGVEPAGGTRARIVLIATSQVLIENFRPRTLEAMGLGPEI